ncbi:MAG: DNA cytosine methyltransferase [Bacteroidaceae bacterium]|nr:DNA cytosine methyltransferase [Bacteroidaceae bacterium]
MINLLYIDLFCGAGGTSSGVEYARVNGEKCAKVVACVNHDKNAILSHQANHPDALHFTEDIRTLELSPMVEHLQRMKNQYPDAYVVLWASLECTNFSRAKGGQPRDADSRTLAEHLFRYIEALQPDYMQIENVEEFMCWGELDKNGKPISRHKGSSYMRWVRHVCEYGYTYDWHLLNAADFGAYTSRKRFFGQFARHGLPIAFPVQTHAKSPVCCRTTKSLFPGIYKPWKPVREVLDLQDEGSSIFTRRKPLCEKTLERIYAGLVKFVAGGKEKADAWILKYNSTNQGGHHNPPGIDEPCPVVAVQNRLGLVKCRFLSKQFSGDPMHKNQSIDRPAGTVTCKDHHAFVTAYYGNGYNSSVDEPAPTVTTKDRLSIVNCQFLDNQYGNGTPASIDSPSPTVVNNPKQSLVSCSVCGYSFATKFLMNPQYQSHGGSINKPCFTLIARMDKMPPYLVTTEQGELAISITPKDSPMTRKVKEFMAAYGIIDIRMRMLKISELKRIMGFPDSYILVGTQADQKKFIGNAVEVNMSRVLCEALSHRLQKDRKAVI